jgi:glutamate synthase domain-containing protein 2
LIDLLQRFGLRDIRDLVGRTDLLEHLDYAHRTESDHNE